MASLEKELSKLEKTVGLLVEVGAKLTEVGVSVVTNLATPPPQVETPGAPVSVETTTPEEVEKPDVGVEDVRQALREYLTNGGSKETARQILTDHGADSVSALKPEEYAGVFETLGKLIDA